jgi:hypothetical protein
VVAETRTTRHWGSPRSIIGTAAGISRDLTYAEQLLLDANNRAEQLSAIGPNPVLANIRSRIASRLAEIYSDQLNAASERYKLRRDLAMLRQCEEWIAKRRRFAPDDYGTRGIAAICAFLLHRDVAVASQEIERSKGTADGAWKYSEAFLLAYQGNLDGAYVAYKKAFTMPLDDVTVPTQCEDFIQIVLEQEPGQYWLYFCLGMINRRAKGDDLAAKRDFEQFLSRVETVVSNGNSEP